ncbi:MAG: ABC transporter substrate-binding protein, partial [bacterium]|nr:ABC transporter substrate-binding protein [bacterium]
MLRLLVLLFVSFIFAACTNNPYRPDEAGRNIYYDTFSEEPKHLDPARAYSSDEYKFINQIYEPAIQYHYLKRPYALTPLTAVAMPMPELYDANGRLLPADAPNDVVVRVVYEITLRPDIRYQDHPAFARRSDGTYRWHLPAGASFPNIDHPNALPEQDRRGLRAEDYVYQIKRLAHPLIECPIFPLLANYIDGFTAFRQTIEKEVDRIRAARRQAGGVFYNQEADERVHPVYLDLRQYNLPGAQVVNDLTFRITLSKKYPQFIYWLAMPFFAPMPWEADRFYTQSAALAQNIILDRFPVGTGPFTLAMNRPNYRMVLRRNPHFHPETYPRVGAPGDQGLDLLADGGKRLPFLDEVVYVLEKESVPRWNKFLQGYYDASGIGSDVFDQAVQVSA